MGKKKVRELGAMGQGVGGALEGVGPGGLPVPRKCWDPAALPAGWKDYTHAWVWHSVVVDCPKYLSAMLDGLRSDPEVLVVLFASVRSGDSRLG